MLWGISMSSHTLASNLLRSSAKDMYGRLVGQVVGISHDTTGDVTAIQVEQGGGSLTEYPISQVSIYNDSVVLIPRWMVESNLINKEWTLTRKKFLALDNLLKSGKVSQVVSESLRKKEFEPAIRKLRDRREVILNELKSRHNELEFQIQKLENSIANIELDRMVGEMDDQTYKTAQESVRPLLESARSEKKDIEAALEQLDELDRAYSQIIVAQTNHNQI